MRRSATLLIISAFLSCREAETPHASPPPPPFDASERGNLLNMAYGASVVSRTAELTLDNSAIRAIDGDPESTWSSPPSDTNQTIVFALPAPARIEQVGARTPVGKSFAVEKMRFETSVDGKKFTTVAEPRFSESEAPQLFPITPVEASYLRVTITEAPGRFAVLQSVHAHGTYVRPPVPQPIAGCWMINGTPASFVEENGQVRGRIGDENPILLQGGVDGALYRLIWIRGPEWGYAAVTISPDGTHLSGIKWHEEPIVYFFGDSWFGEKRSCVAAAPTADISRAFMQHARRLPMYAPEADLAVIMQLLSVGRRVRLVARDYRGVPQKPKLNAIREALRKRRADLSRVEFVAMGNNNPRQTVQNELMRSLYGVVEIEP